MVKKKKKFGFSSFVLSPQKGLETFAEGLDEQRAGLSIPDPRTWSVHPLPLDQPLEPWAIRKEFQHNNPALHQENLSPSRPSCTNSLFKSLIPHKHLPSVSGVCSACRSHPAQTSASLWSCKCLIPSSSSSLGPAQRRTFLDNAVIFPEAKQAVRSSG